MKFFILWFMCFSILFSNNTTELKTTSKKNIFIVPSLSVEKDELNYLKNNLTKIFDYNFVIVNKITLTLNSYNKKRKQYDAKALLNEVENKYKGKAYKILVVINKDLYVENLNFVFGLASLNACIISTYRLKNEFYNSKKDDALFNKRLLTEAVHELGHTFSLSHCQNPNCVMFFSNSILDTDKKGYEFCKRCKKLLR